MATDENSPSSQDDVIQLLDTQIQSMRDEIRKAISRRAALASSLLTSPKLQTADKSGVSKELVKILEGRITKAKRDNVISSHRLSLGATRFTTKDPDPNAIDNREVTGIRIETYNPFQRTFDTPAYLFLNRPWADAGDERSEEDKQRYRVHRHTLPPSVKLDALAHKYLPPPMPLGSVKEAKKQDLQGLVRALRREILSLRKRQDIVHGINRNKKSSETKSKIQAVNAEATDLRIIWSEGGVGRVRLGKDGVITECFVNSGDGARRHSIERNIKSATSVTELGTKLSWSQLSDVES